MAEVDEKSETVKTGRSTSAIVILLVVIAVFAGVLLAKAQTNNRANRATTSTATATSGETSITSVRNDALADYNAAVKTGKPIYVLFHSLT
jgi:cytoskeletal protein RodZ